MTARRVIEEIEERKRERDDERVREKTIREEKNEMQSCGDGGDINQPKPKRKGEEREREEKKENTSKRKEENIEGQEKRRIKKGRKRNENNN